MSKVERIQVFEYGNLQIGNTYGFNKVTFKEKHFNALVKLNELHSDKYFQVGFKKIKFNQYVGVLQVEGLCIEILPKVDKTSSDEILWQNVLVQMLKATNKLKTNNIGNATVNKQNIHLLDVYFEWFLSEVELLIKKGLIRQYYKKEGNLKALKGKLLFEKHLSKNLIHKELFYTEHQIYAKDHLIHQILNQALKIVEKVSGNGYLYNKCKSISLDFPDVKSVNTNESTFKKIKNNRKTKPYQDALSVARLIILNFAPNITRGKEDMLALLFDMNTLWEQYVLIKLKQACYNSEFNVLGQRSKKFWNGITIRPDIVVENNEGDTICIIDTKWKNNDLAKPPTDDLRQMFVYNEYWRSVNSILLYPSNNIKTPLIKNFENQIHSCGLAWFSVLSGNQLNTDIGFEIKEQLLRKAEAVPLV